MNGDALLITEEETRVPGVNELLKNTPDVI